MRNEKTSARVAAIAGKILRNVKGWPTKVINDPELASFWICQGVSASDLVALAASALTQTTDKKSPAKKKLKRKGK